MKAEKKTIFCPNFKKCMKMRLEANKRHTIWYNLKFWQQLIGTICRKVNYNLIKGWVSGWGYFWYALFSYFITHSEKVSKKFYNKNNDNLFRFLFVSRDTLDLFTWIISSNLVAYRMYLYWRKTHVSGKWSHHLNKGKIDFKKGVCISNSRREFK